MTTQRRQNFATRLVRLAVVAALATLLTTAAPVAAGDKPTNDGGATTMGCKGGCY